MGGALVATPLGNNVKKILIIKLLIVSFVFAQSNDVKEALTYYPLHVGDYWQYKVTRKLFGIQDSSWIGYKEVTGDTIMPNGKKYFLIDEIRLPFPHYFTPSFIRVDSNTANVYKYIYEQKEILIDSLLAKKGDVIFEGFKCTSDTLKEIFGENVNTKMVEQYLFSYSYYGWELAKKYGEVMRYYDDLFTYYIHYHGDVEYAKIDGKEYGVKTNIYIQNKIPNQIILFQNYPNPFNPVTTIKYLLNTQSLVHLAVFDILGNQVCKLIETTQPAGSYEIKFNGSNLSSGVYIYRLISNNNILTRKFVLLK